MLQLSLPLLNSITEVLSLQSPTGFPWQSLLPTTAYHFQPSPPSTQHTSQGYLPTYLVKSFPSKVRYSFQAHSQPSPQRQTIPLKLQIFHFFQGLAQAPHSPFAWVIYRTSSDTHWSGCITITKVLWNLFPFCIEACN